MLVVVASEDDMPFDVKVFTTLPEAMALARSHVQDGRDAKVYDVPNAKSAQAAKAAIEMGGGTMIAAPTRQRTTEEMAVNKRRYWRKMLDEL